MLAWHGIVNLDNECRRNNLSVDSNSVNRLLHSIKFFAVENYGGRNEFRSESPALFPGAFKFVLPRILYERIRSFLLLVGSLPLANSGDCGRVLLL